MADSALEILDYPGATGKRQDLREAFMMFNEMSQKLTDSYEFLENRVEQLSGELANVSAQRMQEMAEKERLADKLESLLQLLPAAVLVLDQFGCVRQSNRAADELLLPLAKVESLNGRRWRQLIQTCFKPRRDDGHEISLVDGRRVQVRTAAMTNEPGQVILLTDMTETRQLQAQLSQYERLSAMGKMVASLAHQIRTPLAAATLYAGHLSAPELQDEHRIRFAGKLQERLRHLENQVRDMLIFARGEAPLNDEVSLAELMQGVSDAMEVPLQNSHGTCRIHNEIPDQRLVCNRDALISAVMNLVNNAIESSAAPVHIDIDVIRCGDAQISLTVSDNGPGMTDQQKEKILEPFYTTKANGTGLGLAVVQAVARAHKAEFHLTDSPTGGASAQFILPVH
ncbi:MAG: PAS domain-containing sensor histidine kinase [Oceanospirillaceae bacterium]|uniref:sensor histidine kinase n=2 Tax=unclassified Thalassolituus TaxID=2624967 RepID=UPI000C47D646|nr:ATP-binding protein [Thalassolituus sp. UBA6592]MAS25182.1 PAS domain-containing sensor histidine kinase [Oceanospirillaceae bacterium]MBL33688.1 PAS domain-containing sensor histidine kinase [Oceanospirillaceae bacterium]MBS51686.1 PAS domain-containing sensor histidine kinase [Oceanospirillaceae bacterium]